MGKLLAGEVEISLWVSLPGEMSRRALFKFAEAKARGAFCCQRVGRRRVFMVEILFTMSRVMSPAAVSAAPVPSGQGVLMV